MQTEFKADLMAKLHEIAAKSLTMVDFFARMLVWLFRNTGLILMDSDDLTIRELEGPMFETLIARHVDIQKRVEESAERVRELGYTPQHELQPNMANLFVFDEGERVLLYADRSNEDGFTDRRGTRKYSRMKLMDWAKSSPDRLSNNVMTRPLMQDYLFPVLGAVLGPGEIAYWGLTRESFRELGMQMPILVPRLEFSLVEGTIAKNMLKYGLIFDDVIHRLEQRKQEWLAGQDTLHLDERFRQVKEQFRESYASILETIATINPGLKKLGDTNMTKIIEQIDFLEQKAADGYRTLFDSSLRHWNRIGLSLLPGGRPQERVYNVVVFLNKYGSDWIGKLLESPIAPDGNHRIVYM
jgi:bacillithiol biosynthesis cysteine-adding enzyme BshC